MPLLPPDGNCLDCLYRRRGRPSLRGPPPRRSGKDIVVLCQFSRVNAIAGKTETLGELLDLCR